jgi:hypothetical protein
MVHAANDFNQENNAVNQVQQQQSWQPPSYGWLKCNVNAGFNARERTTNRGWCFRNHAGAFKSACIEWDNGHIQ